MLRTANQRRQFQLTLHHAECAPNVGSPLSHTRKSRMRIEMKKCSWTLIFVLAVLGRSWPQAESEPQPADATVQSSLPPEAPPSDDTTRVVQPSALSGLGPPSLPSAVTLEQSYFLAGAYVSQGAEIDRGSIPQNSSSLFPSAQISGTASLLKFRSRSATTIDYLGGANLYYGNVGEFGADKQQLQQLVHVDQRFWWRKGQLILEDSFGNISSGTFGSSSFGGAALYNLIFAAPGAGVPSAPGVSDFFGADQFDDVQQPRIENTSGAELAEALTPRSSITAVGAFSIADYPANPGNFVDSGEVSAQVGYNYQLSRKDELAIVYGYQSFRFPQGAAGNIRANVAQLVFGRTVSRRMHVLLAAGPELTSLDAGNTRQTNISAAAGFHYQMRRVGFDLSYSRLVTSGSGLFAGANSNVGQFSLGRQMSRAWTADLNAGYVKLSAIEPSTEVPPGSAYQYWFAGAAIERRMARYIRLFAGYQFNSEKLPSTFCDVSGSCNGFTRQNTVSVGINWNARPFRLQ